MASRAFLTFNPDLEASSSLDAKSLPAEEFSDVDAAAKMPLHNEWKVWEQIENDMTGSYTDNMKPISSFNTVQEFWQLWNMLPQPSQLMSDKRMVRNGPTGKAQMVDAIMIFRDEVKPMWEDPLNATGGHFEIRYQQTREPEEQAQLDEHWNNIVLGMVGATIEPLGIITGVRLVDKLHTSGRGGGFIRIEVWYTDLGAADSKHVLRASLERAMTTKLDGSRDPARLQLAMKSHQKVGK